LVFDRRVQADAALDEVCFMLQGLRAQNGQRGKEAISVAVLALVIGLLNQTADIVLILIRNLPQFFLTFQLKEFVCPKVFFA